MRFNFCQGTTTNIPCQAISFASNSDTLIFTSPTVNNNEVLTIELTVNDGHYEIKREVIIAVNQKQKADGVYYYHNDHLGTPQVMTDASAANVWQASYSPFGKAELLVAN